MFYRGKVSCAATEEGSSDVPEELHLVLTERPALVMGQHAEVSSFHVHVHGLQREREERQGQDGDSPIPQQGQRDGVKGWRGVGVDYGGDYGMIWWYGITLDQRLSLLSRSA